MHNSAIINFEILSKKKKEKFKLNYQLKLKSIIIFKLFNIKIN